MGEGTVSMTLILEGYGCGGQRGHCRCGKVVLEGNIRCGRLPRFFFSVTKCHVACVDLFTMLADYVYNLLTMSVACSLCL